jgi:hypothetical protein
MTVDKIVVSMKGAFRAGQAYVALSRVRSLQGLYIRDFDLTKIKADPEVTMEMERLRRNLLPQMAPPQVTQVPDIQWLKISQLNVRSYKEHLPDMQCDHVLQNAQVMCFTETFLREQQNLTPDRCIKRDLEPFRKDRQGEEERGGVMILAARSLHPERDQIFSGSPLEITGILIRVPETGGIVRVAVVYRRPQLPIPQFLHQISPIMKEMRRSNTPTVIMGDFNEDIMKGENQVQMFMAGFGFDQLVQQPTTDSGSLLDHVYFNKNPSNTIVDVVDIYYSDHDATMLSILKTDLLGK